LTGSAGQYGATAHSLIVRSAPLRNLPSCAGSCGSTARQCVAGPRRLPWNTRYHCPPRLTCRGRRRRATVLVQGAGGAVAICAVQLARHAGARVIGTVRSSGEEPAARAAGAHEVALNDQTLAERMTVL